MCAARSRCFWPITRASKPRRGVAGSAGDRQTVARGFCGGCSLMTKPNSARIRLAPTNNSPGVLARRCCVALLLSAAVLSPPLSAATAPPARAATAEAKPGYLIRAEKNYRQARQAVLALQVAQAIEPAKGARRPTRAGQNRAVDRTGGLVAKDARHAEEFVIRAHTRTPCPHGIERHAKRGADKAGRRIPEGRVPTAWTVLVVVTATSARSLSPFYGERVGVRGRRYCQQCRRAPRDFPL